MALRPRETRRRVKLYSLNDELQWEDKGTGHVTIASGSGVADWVWPVLCVRSEEDGETVVCMWSSCACVLHGVGGGVGFTGTQHTPNHLSNCVCYVPW